VRGIILAGGKGTRLYPLTLGVSKQLLSCYDKPIIYYPLSTLLLAGIRDIVIISKSQDAPLFYNVLGDGSRFGCNLNYVTQDDANGIAEAYILAEKYNSGTSTSLILGDNIFIGSGLGTALRNDQDVKGAILHGTRVRNPSEFGIAHKDSNGKVTRLEEKPLVTDSNLAVTGLYITDSSVYERVKEIKPSARGELEILSLMSSYLASGEIELRELERGTAWFDTGTTESLFEASEYVKVIQSRQNRLISSPEEIAWRNNWISSDQLIESANKFTAGFYKEKLLELISE